MIDLRLKIPAMSDQITIGDMPQIKTASAGHSGRIGLRWAAAGFFLLAGLNHFLIPGFYQQIVPPGFPSPKMLVIISGLAEMAGGLGLLIRPVRRLAGWGLILLLIAMFPANIYMAVYPEGFGILPWFLWLRLPAQGLFAAWVWIVAISDESGREGR
ncbi:MAG TPA: DoxX family membrane protein [Verrucomicrobiae bacterium]|jgi:uncharacterized membrane protein